MDNSPLLFSPYVDIEFYTGKRPFDSIKKIETCFMQSWATFFFNPLSPEIIEAKV